MADDAADPFLTIPVPKEETPAPKPVPKRPEGGVEGAATFEGLAGTLGASLAPAPVDLNKTTTNPQSPASGPGESNGDAGEIHPLDALAEGASKIGQSIAGLVDQAPGSYVDDAEKMGYPSQPGKPGDRKLDTAPTLGVDHPKQSPVNGLISGAAEFIGDFVGAGKFLKAGKLLQGASTATNITRVAVQSGMAQAATPDANQTNLNNFIESFPSLANPVSAFLSADPNDSEMMGRAKKFIEGAGLGAATEGFLKVLGAMKEAKANPAAAHEIITKAADEVGTPKPPEAAPEVTPKAAAKVAEDDWVTPTDAEAATGGPAPKPNTGELLNQNLKDHIVSSLGDSNQLGPMKSPNVDFNFDKFLTPEGPQEAIQLVSDALAPEIEKLKGGVQTLKETQDLSDILGENPAKLYAGLSQDAKSASDAAARVVAGKRMLQSLAQKVYGMSQAVKNGAADDALKDTLAKHLNLMAGLQSNLKATITGAARATSAGRIFTAGDLNPQFLHDFAMSGGDPVVIGKMIRDKSLYGKVADSAIELRINAMLSNPVTHAANILSNTIKAFTVPAENVLSGALRFNPGAMQEGVDQVIGMFKGFQDSVVASSKALSTEVPVLEGGGLASNTVEHTPAISAQGYGFAPGSFLGNAADYIGKVVRIPTRLLSSEDEFFKQISFRGSLYASAMKAGRANGLTGQALADSVEQTFNKALDAQGAAIATDPNAMAALQFSKEATFTQALADGTIGKILQNGAQQNRAIRMVAPFVRTPVNIFGDVLDRCPVISQLAERNRAIWNQGGDGKAKLAARWATGGGLFGGGMLMAASGNLTGSGPSDPDKLKELKNSGWQPYSVKVGDQYYSYNRADPLGIFLGLAADSHDASGSLKDAQWEQLSGHICTALARNLESKTYFKGLADFFNAASTPDRFAQTYFNGLASSFVPSGAKPISNALGITDDNSMHEARGVLDAMKAKVPGLSKDVPPVRNLFGEPVNVNGAWGPDWISPITTSRGMPGSVQEELAKVGGGFGPPPKKIGPKMEVDLTQYKNAQGQDAADRWAELQGKVAPDGLNLKEQLKKLIASPEYQKLTYDDGQEEGSRKEVLRNVIGKYKLAAQNQMMDEFPQVRKDFTAARIKAKQALVAPPAAQAPASGPLGALSGLLNFK